VAWLHSSPPASLDLQCNAEVTRIIFDGARRALAVEYLQGGQRRMAELSGELILCAGALESPRLLLLSGVGPAADLKQLGISVVQDAPGIGKNLQDHPNVSLMYKSQYPVDFLFPQVYAFDYARRPADGPRDQASDVCFVCHAVGPTLKTGMLRMLPIMALPGRLYHFTPLRKLLRGLVHLLFALPGLKRSVSSLFGIVVILGKPRSRGSVQLRSADPKVPADIDLAFFRDPDDRVVIEAALAKARDIVAQSPLAGAKPLAPGGKPDVASDTLWKWIHGMTMTTFHYSGTCSMGEDAESPVDSQLRVKGLANVRVADASVMPEAPVSALNAPSMMIGYRAADFILANRRT
jgi:choline dehydrogenase-like flavoprotein